MAIRKRPKRKKKATRAKKRLLPTTSRGRRGLRPRSARQTPRPHAAPEPRHALPPFPEPTPLPALAAPAAPEEPASPAPIAPLEGAPGGLDDPSAIAPESGPPVPRPRDGDTRDEP
ncbi:hypothetical protein HY478_03380 [Candidatus Uhrbacteria bacterium]|nr:hypothetical protein [Candidatus Uhrbacteria bacterium]